MAIWWGFNPSFIDNKRGVLPRQEDSQLIKNDILQLILTIPGERIHRPDFGTIVRSSIFEPITDNLLEDIRVSIITALGDEEPRVSNPDVQITADPDSNMLNIRVVATLNFDPSLTIDVATKVRFQQDNR